MRKFSISALVLTIASFGLYLSSCKSHETPAKPKLSFSEATKTVTESDGTIEVTMKLDKAAGQDITVSYTLSGTAKDKVSAGSNAAYDYEITTTYLETKILKGEVEGTISVKLASDFSFEDSETIIVHITDVDSQDIEITREDDCTITVNQEDGLGIFLEWGVNDGETYTDVDMDLFLWTEDNTQTLQLTASSTAPSFQSPEFIFAPMALNDGTIGLSANYYEGTEDPMNFQFTFITYIAGVEGEPVIETGTYSAANVNPWFTSGVDPLVVETFEKSGTTFSNFSPVTIPQDGSRMGTSHTATKLFQREPLEPGYQKLLFPSMRKK